MMISKKEKRWKIQQMLYSDNSNMMKFGSILQYGKDVCSGRTNLELFLRNLILDEKNELHNRTMHISGTFDHKLDIESAKLDIQDAKLDIRNQLLAFSNTVSEKTINHAIGLFLSYRSAR